MKKSLIIFSAVCVSTCFTAGNGFAEARSPSNEGRDYVNGARSMANWSVGAYYETAKKDLKFDTLGTRTVSSDRAMAYVGYDAFAWLSPYLTAGQSHSKVANSFGNKDSQFDYGLGAQLNMFDYEIPDSFLMEDHIRLNSALEYTRTTMAVGRDDVGVGQFEASLTVSVVNDVVGATEFIPESIAFFAGPMYSTWMGSEIKGSQKSRDDVGFTLGLEVFYTRSVSLNARINLMEHPGASAGLNVHF